MPLFEASLSGNLNVSADSKVLRIQGIPETTDKGVIFTNEFYDTPLYRAPNNGLVYKMPLAQYKAKNCAYAFNGDTNGLAYWAATSFGKSIWKIPDSSLGWYVYSSGNLIDENLNPVDGDTSSLFDRSSKLATTNDAENSTFQILLLYLGESEGFYPSGIYLKSPSVETYGFIKNWDIEYNFVDGNTDRQSFVNDDRLVGINKELYIPKNNNVVICNSVIIRQTGLNSIGTNHLCLGEIELYGIYK